MRIATLKIAIAMLLFCTPNALLAQSRQEILNEARKYEPIGLSLIDLSLSAAKVDNDITLLVNRVLPDIIDENIDRAVNDAMEFMYRKTGKRYFDPYVKMYVETKFKSSLNAALNKDYVLLVENMVDFVLVTDNLIKYGTVPSSANLSSNVLAAKIAPPVSDNSEETQTTTVQAKNTLKLINNTSKVIIVSFAYFDKGDNCWVSRGWRRLDANGGTNVINLDELNMGNNTIYLHAHGKGVYWGNDVTLCAEQGKFRRTFADKGSCDWKLKYNKINVRAGDNTYNFNL